MSSKDYRTAYDDTFRKFEISDIVYEEGGGPNQISFEYENPDVAVDTSGRFAVHEIIGGSTVRQKIGSNPLEADISGVCLRGTATVLDNLRRAKYATIISHRFRGGSITAQIASVSTSPMESGGAVMADSDGIFLYQFDMSIVEVETDDA